MNEITEGRVNEAIDSIFLEINENFLNGFKANYDGFNKIINDDADNLYPNYASNAAFGFAAFKTARDYSVEIMRSVLKELLCDQSSVSKIENKKI